MLYLLDPRVWIAAAIVLLMTFTNVVAYRAGAKGVQVKWDAQRAADTQLLLKKEQEYRAREQELLAAKQESEVKYVELKKRFDRDAAGARAELERLRALLYSPGPAKLSANPAPITRIDAGPGPVGELLGTCAQALVGLAAEADRLEAQLIGLQNYVSGVLLKANK